MSSIIQTHFSDIQVLWIMVAFAFGITSIVLMLYKRYKLSLLFLFIAGTILRLIAAGLDPFLNTWDEQFHALVAKNMIHHPFRPMLIENPVLDYDYRSWISNHIWLHKPPWFLWQIALFFKIFGVSEFVLRLPTAIMFSLLIPIIYRIGKLFGTKEIAWSAAFLYSFSCFFINFVSGVLFTDHNDSAFLFYIALSLWAWAEYMHSPAKKWIIMIGLFAGIAILNKWLAGLLVYSGWFAAILETKGKEEKVRELKNLGFALLITLVVALPWQIYTMIAYPRESLYVFLFNSSKHLIESLDTHSENRWYYFYQLSTQYGGLIVFFILLPGLHYLLQAVSNRSVKAALVTWLVVTYVFFTLAATKMPMFCTIVSPVIFLVLGAFLARGISLYRRYLPSKKFLFLPVLLLGYIAWDNLSVNDIDDNHSTKQTSWNVRRTDAIIDKYAAAKLADKDRVLFNCGKFNVVMYMFYGENTAYGFYPDRSQYLALKEKGIKMATFVNEGIPQYLKHDPEVMKIYLTPVPY